MKPNLEKEEAFKAGYLRATLDMVDRVMSMPKRLGGCVVFNRDNYMKDFKDFTEQTATRCSERLEEHNEE